MNSIVGFSQLLVDIYQDNPETKEFVSIIEVNSDNLLRLINDVLDISFLDQSEEVPYDKVEDINISCLSGMEAIRTLVREGVELEFRPSVERCLIKTNPGRVSQILIHLLQNAAKFTDNGSIVLDYELKRDERKIIYRVTETGIDIHPGAKIGHHFTIDHGTGVVIGATSIIGNNVKLYQGVTLGAKSFPLDDNGNPIKGIPRHPILEDDVIVYSNATILGRVTIGKGATVGGNIWVTENVPAGARIVQRKTKEGEKI